MPLYSSVIDLSTLNGVNSFQIDGIDAGDQSGPSVAGASDVNGDCFDDLIIGAFTVERERQRFVETVGCPRLFEVWES